jgi:predicted Zn-dependent peptidase
MLRNYEMIHEKVYTETMVNGLEVTLVPKKGFKKSFVIFGTKYGALVNRFIPYGEEDWIEVPLGIAHFLEHKMFEMKSGEDATDLFAKLGLESNAMTNYNMTAYLFSGTKNIPQGIELLLDFVQDPYFTEENIKKEQGIIDQELKMYMDDPGDAIHLGLMGNLFQVYPLKYDIGGTVESIREINIDYLYKCYQTFYHPSNMFLVIAGDPDLIIGSEYQSIEKIFDLVKMNQNKKWFRKPRDIRKNIYVEDENAFKSTGSKKMDIAMPKTAIGVKLPYVKYSKNQAMMTELEIKILMEATFGPSADAFQEMLDKELITGNIYYEVYTDGLSGYVKIQANSYKPKQFIAYIKEKLLGFNDMQLDKEVFDRFKKSIMGNFLRSLNSPEFIASSYLEYRFKESDIFEAIELFDKLSASDLKKMGMYFTENAIADYTLLPKASVSH